MNEEGFMESIKDITFEELFPSKEKAVEMYLRLERRYLALAKVYRAELYGG